MKKNILLLTMMGMATSVALAQNPIIRDQYTADPTARVFNGKMYVYPSHDIVSPVEPEKKWFSMEDYHVFSSENLTDWTDHGAAPNQLLRLPTTFRVQLPGGAGSLKKKKRGSQPKQVIFPKHLLGGPPPPGASLEERQRSRTHL